MPHEGFGLAFWMHQAELMKTTVYPIFTNMPPNMRLCLRAFCTRWRRMVQLFGRWIQIFAIPIIQHSCAFPILTKPQHWEHIHWTILTRYDVSHGMLLRNERAMWEYHPYSRRMSLERVFAMSKIANPISNLFGTNIATIAPIS